MTAVASAAYAGWGRGRRVPHRVARPASADEAAAVLRRAGGPVLAHGCGRSYGDVALNPDGLLVDCRALDRFIAFDRATGRLTCEAGVRLADILAVLCRSEADGSGYFLPVSPGTRFVTVGGAIANDVHGKNHHAAGTFGAHVESLDLLRSDGQVLRCSATENRELFAATVGGLGLTGLILRATLRLRRVEGLAVEAEDIRFGSLGDFFALSAESDDGAWEYTAAWIDCFAGGAALGRGIFSRARHAPGRAAPPPSREPRLAVPLTPPLPAVTGLSARLFNALYGRRLGRKGIARRTGSYERVLYPLDAVGAWNRLYGPKGFFQFQAVVPKADAREAVAAMLREAAGEGSMLTVLKVFCDKPSPGLLSFPMEGATLALDFPNRGEGTVRLVKGLERIAIDAGGRIYPAKDSLMSPESFFGGYPAAERFRASMDPAFSSAFSRRVGLQAKISP